MNGFVIAFILGATLGVAISQFFRLRDLARISKYIDENNRLLMTNMDIAEENQALLEQLAKRQGVEWTEEKEPKES